MEISAPITPRARLPRLETRHLVLSGDRIFVSVQGEGATMGTPSAFLRLHYCNLTCAWCDTRYTWDRGLPEFWSEPEAVAVESVAEELAAEKVRNLVITGGEPLLQQAALVPLVHALEGWTIEIETNGTIAPHPDLARRCRFNVSPKLRHSGVRELKRKVPAALRELAALDGTTFKFVAIAPSDLEEISELTREIGIRDSAVLVMPEGSEPELLAERMRELAPALIDRAWRLAPRLHVILWGKRRRV